MFWSTSKLHVLIYHRVLPSHDPLRPDCLTKEQFHKHLKIFKKWFHVVPLIEGYHRMLEGSLPPRSICITFDDGYQDNVDVAMPMLKSFDMPATFFIATAFLQEGLMFNDVIIERVKRTNQTIEVGHQSFACDNLCGKLAAIQALTKKIKTMSLVDRQQALVELWPNNGQLPRLMVKPAGVRALETGGMTVGAHTMSHPLLSQESDEVAKKQIQGSKDSLEDILQKPVSWFAYPNGKKGVDFEQKHANMVKELEFAGALSTDWGMVTKQSDAYSLPRFTPWQTKSKPFAVKMATHRLSRSY